MHEIRRILVPTDFSDRSVAAVSYALFVAERFSAKVELLHVWEPSPYVTPSEVIMIATSEGHDELAERMKRELSETMDEFITRSTAGSDCDIKGHVEAGYPSHSIIKWLESGDYDLVVLGTHGRTGLPHLLMGSVAERIVRLAPVPVLTVRTGGPDAEPGEK
jgi:universal stress protein A